MMHIDGSRITLPAFAAAIETAVPLEICAKTRERVAAAHAFVDVVAAGPEPVYGLNTGLGARLDQRIPPEDIGAFQSQIIQGRAVACGDPLPEETGRGVLLSRIVTAALGCSGMSGGIFDNPERYTATR
ncbi:MAG: aromatic amino acid lyase [Pseudomonadota bacterium]